MGETYDELGKKLWQCNVCLYTRAKKSNVSNHIEYKHMQIQVTCHLCHASFGRRDKLFTHLKQKHPETYFN